MLINRSGVGGVKTDPASLVMEPSADINLSCSYIP